MKNKEPLLTEGELIFTVVLGACTLAYHRTEGLLGIGMTLLELVIAFSLYRTLTLWKWLPRIKFDGE